jgi:hypothetical protein
MSAPVQDTKPHERLIDHFKRVYSIVAGLALTDACRRALPIADLGDYRLWMFAAFFVTLVPIFHGGDRSLDQKYLRQPPRGAWPKIWFLWDDYMLLLTAVFFVCIADSIPSQSATDLSRPDLFYRWMAAMLGFDVFVLVIDRLKNRGRADLAPYRVWIPINLVMAMVCVWASLLAGSKALPQSWLSAGIFALAAGRTVLDYWAGKSFLFPDVP